MWRVLLILWFLTAPVWAARDFNGTTQNAEISTALFTDEPATICAWFRMDTFASIQNVASVGNTSNTDGVFGMLLVHLDVSVRANKRTDTGTSQQATAVGVSANIWTHACVVFSDASQSVSLNGATFVTNSNSAIDPTADVSSIAVQKNSGYQVYLDGQVGYTDWWDVELFQHEVAALAAGACPVHVRPNAHISSVPLWGASSPEPDRRAARSWTLINSPAAGTSGPPVACTGRR